jgi:hypothetical protein
VWHPVVYPPLPEAAADALGQRTPIATVPAIVPKKSDTHGLTPVALAKDYSLSAFGIHPGLTPASSANLIDRRLFSRRRIELLRSARAAPAPPAGR